MPVLVAQTILSLEAILLWPALHKAWFHRRCANDNTLMQQLTRNSEIYFTLIFWIYVANMVIWIKKSYHSNHIDIDDRLRSTNLAYRSRLLSRAYYQIGSL